MLPAKKSSTSAIPDFLKGYDLDEDDFLTGAAEFGISTLDEDDIANNAVEPDHPELQETMSGMQHQLDSIIEKIGDPESVKFDAERAYGDALNREIEIVRSKLKTVETLILPLLVNLIKGDALKKAYIHWPNRGPVIEAQIKKILAVTRSLEKEEEEE